MASVRVAVRVRPLNTREKQLSSRLVVRVKGKTASIHKPGGDKFKDKGKIFSFDFSYDSTDRGSPTFASQEKVFKDLGSDVLKAAFEGFNVCVFAYGQTGSGKSYTMMGHTCQEDKGLIPRICEGLFSEISERRAREAVSYRTEVSYVEIYNEHVHDLLKKRSSPTAGGGLRVREHPTDGPYVENLSELSVHSHSDMEELIVLGNGNRTTAVTGMNASSSRSHAIFTLTFTQAWFDAEFPRETLSKIHLVDLAGSERAAATCSSGARLKEGASINKSLVTLGSVISALADLGGGGQQPKKKQIFIPYRDSVLTWLLKNSLGGNSMTTMIATVSPADVNYVETLSTLRYASRAKRIVNTPAVNEGGGVKVIRQLQAELSRLRRLLQENTQVSLSSSVEVKEELHHNEEKREAVALRREGGRLILDCQLPHLIGTDHTGVILYYLKEGRTVIGREGASRHQDIKPHGPLFAGEQCVLEHRGGIVTLIPQEAAQCSVNGSVVTDGCQLTHGAVIRLGRSITLRFNHPAEAAQLSGKCQNVLSAFKSTENLSEVMLQTPGRMEGNLSQQEAGQQQQAQENLNRCNLSIKRPSKQNSEALRQKTTRAEMQETDDGHTDLQAAECKVPGCCVTSAQTETTTARAGNSPVPHAGCEWDGGVLQGGVRPGDGGEQQREPYHKSGPELASERPWREARSGAAVGACEREEVGSGDGSLQQTGVLGAGDGCVTEPKGKANEIGGVVAADEGRLCSGGSSLSSLSHLSSSTNVLPVSSSHSLLHNKPQSSQEACCPPEETSSSQGCAEMDECGVWEEAPRPGGGSLVSRVSQIFQDAAQLLRSSHTVLQQVREEGLNHVVSLLRESTVVSAVKGSQIFSTLNGSFVLSWFKDSSIFSVVRDVALRQHIQMEITQNLQPEEAAPVIQGCIKPNTSQLLVPPPTKTFSKADQPPRTPGEVCSGSEAAGDLWLRGQNMADVQVKRGHKVPADVKGIGGQDKNRVHMLSQALIQFPDSLLSLRALPLCRLISAVQPVISSAVPPPLRVVGVFWLSAATWSCPDPRPALLLLLEAGLCTLTSDRGLLRLLHHLPLLQLKEVQVNLAGHSLRLMGSTAGSVLGVYTHSQQLTKRLCSAVLGVICPGDGRVSEHPLLRGDLLRMSLAWGAAAVPDMLLDAGLRVCCQFQRSLANLVYLLHCNMEEGSAAVGELRLLLYTGVGVCAPPRSQALAQLFLTDAHLGLVQEDAVFHPPPRSVAMAPSRPQFSLLRLRRRSDLRCVLLHEEHQSGAVTLDLILANRGGRGHRDHVTPPARASNSWPHAEVWKLTFSCSSEAACLIDHLSSV